MGAFQNYFFDFLIQVVLLSQNRSTSTCLVFEEGAFGALFFSKRILGQIMERSICLPAHMTRVRIEPYTHN